MIRTTEAEHGARREEGAPSPLSLLLAPDRAMERQGRVGRVRAYLLFAWVCQILLGALLALRVDARSSTLHKLDLGGQLQGMSDRQIAEETHNAERIFQVGSVAKAVVGVPVQLGLSCLAILFLVWFFRGRAKGRAVVPIAAATLLPGALASLLDAVVAFRHTALPPEAVTLSLRSLAAVLPLLGRPLTEPWIKLAGACDFFSLWAAVMMGFGVAAAGQVPKKTAVAGTLIAWVCYRLVTQVGLGA